ncbi:hypothetical protein AYI68_g7407 [Smittium mucronatum]|uniref:Uncharacterized protein n=1 Tax=Smittium mucronatum TaxID=133383 RepID=A0A1R0GNS2_9FUNG|nr:hypothetical protein AYI68_g7407 [Smittium mucronatum]
MDTHTPNRQNGNVERRGERNEDTKVEKPRPYLNRADEIRSYDYDRIDDRSNNYRETTIFPRLNDALSRENSEEFIHQNEYPCSSEKNVWMDDTDLTTMAHRNYGRPNNTQSSKYMYIDSPTGHPKRQIVRLRGEESRFAKIGNDDGASPPEIKTTAYDHLPNRPLSIRAPSEKFASYDIKESMSHKKASVHLTILSSDWSRVVDCEAFGNCTIGQIFYAYYPDAPRRLIFREVRSKVILNPDSKIGDQLLDEDKALTVHATEILCQNSPDWGLTNIKPRYESRITTSRYLEHKSGLHSAEVMESEQTGDRGKVDRDRDRDSTNEATSALMMINRGQRINRIKSEGATQ